MNSNEMLYILRMLDVGLTTDAYGIIAKALVKHTKEVQDYCSVCPHCRE